MIFPDGGIISLGIIIRCELLNNCWHFICGTNCYFGYHNKLGISFGIGISVSSNVNCWTIVGISFMWQIVILVIMSSSKLFMKWVFCWHCSVSSKMQSVGRLSSEVISVVEKQKGCGGETSKCRGVLTLVIVFLSNNWDILTAMQSSSKLVPLVLLIFFSNCFNISTVFTFSNLRYCKQYLTM